MTEMIRATYLITKAKEALDNGRDPLSTSFLVENHITLDEAYKLSDTMSLGLDLVLGFLGAKHESTP
jgi:hypothetical protein